MESLTIEGIHKYGYGLLNLDKETLYNMDAFDFLEYVDGKLLWQEEKEDNMLEWLSWFFANNMMASGNVQKSMDAQKLKESMFKTGKEYREEQHKDTQKEFDDEKAKLIKRFGLEN